MSLSPMAEPARAGAAAEAVAEAEAEAWPALPTETDIYILPDGRVVIADLPEELAPLAAALGAVESSEIAPHVQPDPAL
jgi:hypothetical protein